MSVTNPGMRQLSSQDRQALEARLAEFVGGWEESRLAAEVLRLPPPGTSLRLALLIELIKIDQERHWERGRRPRLEAYLRLYPELLETGSPPADLLETELRLRRQFTASPPATEPELQPGRRREPPEEFGRYRVLRKLGRGGMGAVYLAHDTQLDRPVALKIPHFTARDEPNRLERFYREARAAAALRHPNLCPVHDVGEIDGVPYLTMAYVEGRPLADVVRAGPLPENEAAGLVCKLALALDEAHRQGVVHRDLKPSNVMIDRRNEPIILDFGLARRAGTEEARLTQEGAVFGTPAYMAPEQVKGQVEAMGPRCDVYSLGVMLYEMLTGRLPFQGATAEVLAQVLADDPPPPSKFRSDLAPKLEAVCLKAMARKAEDRYATAGELAAGLKEWLGPRLPPTVRREVVPATAPARPGAETVPQLVSETGAILAVPAAPIAEGAGPAGRRHWWPWALAALIPAAVLLTVLLSRNRTPNDPQGQNGSSGHPVTSLPGPSGDDRAAAAWALRLGAVVWVAADGQDREVRSAAALPREALRVTGIRLERNSGADLDTGLATLKGLTGLRVLNLSGLSVTDRGLEHLRRLATLETLELSGTQVTNEGLKTLKGLTSLRELSLPAGVTDDGLAHLAPLRRLRRLALEGIGVTGPGLAHVGRLPELEQLSLVRMRVTGAAITPLKGLPRLASLDLEGTSVKNLDGLKGMTNLIDLGLGGTAVGDGDLVHLGELTSLRSLRLDGTPITERGLVHLRRLTRLENLSLNRTEVADVGPLGQLPGLVGLYLNESKLDDRGLTTIDRLVGLRVLQLNKTGLTDAAFGHLERLGGLEELSLSGTRVSDAGVVRLGALKKLRRLYLNDVPGVTAAGAKELGKALPGCQVSR